MEHMGFHPSLKDGLLNGKILSTGMPEMEKLSNELAVSAVMLVVRRPMPEVIKAYMDGATFRLDPDIIDHKLIADDLNSGPKAEAAFKGIQYTSGESSEIQKLLKASAGTTFNLNLAEIKQFRVIGQGDAKAREKVSSVYRRALLERFRAYLGQGVDGIARYDRSGKEFSSPAKELTIASASMKHLEKHFPDLYAVLLGFPKKSRGKIKHEFYWIKQKIGKRPAFILSHRMGEIRGEYGIVAEQQFYVGHSYNSLQALIGAVPYKGGTVVFYTNRVFTEQVTGFGSGIKRMVGRGRIEEAVAAHFKKLRMSLESGK